MGRGNVENLQNMVLDILAPEGVAEEKALSLREEAKKPCTPFEALEESRELESTLADSPEQETVLREVSNLVALITGSNAASGRYSRLAHGQDLSLLLLEYLRGETEVNEIIDWVHNYANSVELNILTSTNEQRLGYLEDFWGDETNKEVAEMLNTKPATVKRWVEGANASSSNTSKMNQIIAVLYNLTHRCEMNKEEAITWLNEVQPALGETPKEKIRTSSYWSINKELGDIINSMGGEV